MRTLPTTMIRVLAPFAPLFSERVLGHVQVLLAGAILAPGKRTVSSALRAMGLDQRRNFHRYHRVLEPREVVEHGGESGAVRVAGGGLRAEGAARGGHRRDVGAAPGKEDRGQGHLPRPGEIQPHPLRQNQRPAVDMRDAAVPRSRGPLGSGRCRSCRRWPTPNATPREQGKRHKTLTEWAGQMLLVVRRWCPERQIVAVADGGYASLKLLDRCRHWPNPITFITRLRLDAALYEPAPPRKPGQIGRPRLKGERLAEPLGGGRRSRRPPGAHHGQRLVRRPAAHGGGRSPATAVWYSTGLPAVPLRWVLIRDPQGEFETQALLCTDLDADPERIISWFVQRWQMEATFQEMRQRLGFETQRQWSERRSERTAPALLGLFSVRHAPRSPTHGEGCRSVPDGRLGTTRRAPTFSDALALVRKKLWAQEATFCGSVAEDDTVKVPREVHRTANRHGLLCSLNG